MFFSMRQQRGIQQHRPTTFANALTRCWLALTALLLLSACEQTDADRTELTDTYLMQAQAYFDSGQYRAATIEARNAIQSNPQSAQGYAMIGKIYNALGMYKQTADVFDKVPANVANGLLCNIELAQSHAGRSKFQSAIDTLKQCSDNAEADVITARALVGLDKTQQAKPLLDHVLETSPTHLAAIFALARLHMAAGDIDAAVALAQRARDIDADDPDTSTLLAQTAIAQDDLDSAESHLSDAIGNMPTADTMTLQKANVLRLLSLVLTHSGKSSEALVYSRMLANAFPGAEVAAGDYREAGRLYNEGDLEGANTILTQLVADYPGHEEASVLLGVIRYRMGDTESATRYFSDNLDPETAPREVTRLALLSSIKNNKPEKVIAMLEDTIGQVDDADILSIYGISALSIGRETEGENVLQRAITLAPEKTSAYIALARYYNGATIDQPQKALEILDSGYQKNPTSIELGSALTAQLLEQDRMDDAKTIVDRRLADFPNDFQSHMLAGDFEMRARQAKRAAKHFGTAAQLNKQSVSSRLKLASAQLALAQPDRAEQTYRAAHTLDRNNIEAIRGLLVSSENTPRIEPVLAELATQNDNLAALQVLTEYYLGTGTLNEAERFANRIAVLQPDSGTAKRAQYLVVTGKLEQQLQAQNYTEARNIVGQALAQMPDALPLHIALVDIELGTGNFDEAHKLITQIEQDAPDIGSLLRGDLLFAQGDITASLKHYQSSWAKNATDNTAIKLHRALMAVDSDKAHNFVQRWLQQLPDSLRAMSHASLIALGAENYSRAIPLLEKIRIAQPGSALNLNNLAWAYQQVGDKRALATVREAAELAPNSAAIQDTYGWILFQYGSVTDALAVLEKALTLDPNNAEIADHVQQAKQAR